MVEEGDVDQTVRKGAGGVGEVGGEGVGAEVQILKRPPYLLLLFLLSSLLERVLGQRYKFSNVLHIVTSYDDPSLYS